MIAALALILLAAAILSQIGTFLMKRFAIVAALAVASLSLSGCITSQIVKDLTPEAKERLALKFFERCGGTVNIGAGGASGQLGGGVHGEFQLNGTCPTPTAPTLQVIPLSQLGTTPATTPPAVSPSQ